MRLYHHESEEIPPLLSHHSAAFLSILVTLGYVIPFYLFSTTRPTRTLSRDAPSVIRTRVRIVSMACIVTTVAALMLMTQKGNLSMAQSLKILGWWPVSSRDIFCDVLLTAILFAGPLFERGAVEGGWKGWIRGQGLSETLGSWIGFRNFIAGPITEEITFRSIIISLHLLDNIPASRIVFVSPLYFGIAHIHHLYEFRLTHPETPMIAAVFRSLFQFTYTTLFGWYAAFLYLRTGSLPGVILAHSFCNWMGLPRLWGRVESTQEVFIRPTPGPPNLKKEDTDPQKDGAYPAPGTGRLSNPPLGIAWTVAYYLLLVAGAYGFWKNLWVLTESKGGQLAAFK